MSRRRWLAVGSQWRSLQSIQNGAVNGSGSIFPGSNGQELLMSSGTGDRIATSVAATPISGAVLTFDLIIGNGTGSSGNGADNFFRKYGDNDGNRAVDLFDFADFRSTFGRFAGDAGYIDPLDFDENQTINLFDFAAFRVNFGT